MNPRFVGPLKKQGSDQEWGLFNIERVVNVVHGADKTTVYFVDRSGGPGTYEGVDKGGELFKAIAAQLATPSPRWD